MQFRLPVRYTALVARGRAELTSESVKPMRTAGQSFPVTQVELTALLRELPNASVLRIRCADQVWTCSNRDNGVLTECAFRTASVTKTFTAALVLLLWEQGALALSDRLPKYLPVALLERVHVLDGVPLGTQMTVEQLLQHRAGLFDYATSPAFMAQVAAHPARAWTPLDLLEQAIQGGAPYFAPGQGMNYSDTGYVLLALVLEKVMGMPLAQAYRQHLLQPLGLACTWLEGLEPARAPTVSHAFAGLTDTSHFNPSFDTCGGGGLISTAADLDRYISSLLAGRVFRHPETLRRMKQGTDAPPGTGTRKTRTAAGLSAFAIADQPFWGHLGHWNSFMLHAAERDFSICGSFNQAQDDPRHRLILETAAATVAGLG